MTAAKIGGFIVVLAVALLATSACKQESYIARSVPAITQADNGITLTVEPSLVKVGDLVRLKIDFDVSRGLVYGNPAYLQKWTGEEWTSIYWTSAKPGDDTVDAPMSKIKAGQGTTDEGYTQPSFQVFRVPKVSPGNYRIWKQALLPGGPPTKFDAYASFRVVNANPIG